MRRLFAWPFLVSGLILAATAAQAESGLQPGAAVRIEKGNGKAFDGKLTDLSMKDDAFPIYTLQNVLVRTQLKDIKKIADTGKKIETDYGVFTAKSTATVYEIIKTDGERLEGVISRMPVFEIDMGASGVQKNVWLSFLKSIEAAEGGAPQPAGNQTPANQVTVTCPRCGKPVTVHVDVQK